MHKKRYDIVCVNRHCINNRLFTLVFMQYAKWGHRLIFHTAVFRHLSLKIMAAIKHFPALFWLGVCVRVCAFPCCRSRHTLPFFAVTFPLISPSVLFCPASLRCLSNLIWGNFFAIFRRHPPSPLATVSFVR